MVPRVLLGIILWRCDLYVEALSSAEQQGREEAKALTCDV